MQEKKNLPVEESGKKPTVSQTLPKNEDLSNEELKKVTGGGPYCASIDHSTVDI